MTAMRKWKIILALAAIFAAGVVTGGVFALGMVKQAVDRKINPGRWPASLLDTYQKRLKLTPEQIEQMRPVIEESRREWSATVRSAVGSYAAIIRKVDEQLAPLLTPEQKAEHERIREEVRARFRKQFNVAQGKD
jgi:Spy/CpxP family protein refolding chaperone